MEELWRVAGGRVVTVGGRDARVGVVAVDYAHETRVDHDGERESWTPGASSGRVFRTGWDPPPSPLWESLGGDTFACYENDGSHPT